MALNPPPVLEVSLIKNHGSLAPTKSLLVFSENSRDPNGPFGCPGAQRAKHKGVKGRLKQLTEQESHLTRPHCDLRGRFWLPLRVPVDLSLKTSTKTGVDRDGG